MLLTEFHTQGRIKGTLFVKQYLKGLYHSPDWRTLHERFVKLANHLGVIIDELFTDKNEPNHGDCRFRLFWKLREYMDPEKLGKLQRHSFVSWYDFLLGGCVLDSLRRRHVRSTVDTMCLA